MFENSLIKYCSPTLARLKSGSIFSFEGNFFEIELAITNQNQALNKKGVYITCLSYKNSKALIYVYRPEMLIKDFQEPKTNSFLLSYGYDASNPEKAISKLSNKIKTYSEFPHEIGLFLSYPIDDVISFINNKGCNCLFTGYWKVYHNAEAAEKAFSLYRKCSTIYANLFNNGKPLEQLVVIN